MLVWTSLIAREKRRALLSVSGVVLGALFFVHLAGFYGWTLPWTLGGIVVLALVVRSVGAALRFLALHPFSACDLGLSEAAAPGGAVRCAVRIVSRRPVEIKDLRITLTADSRDGAGRTERLFFLSRGLLGHTSLPAGERLEAAAELAVPEDAPFSYRSFEGRIRWLARARLEAVNFGPAEEEIEVLMAPGA